MYILFNITEKSNQWIQPENVINTDSSQVAKRYLHGYCLDKVYQLGDKLKKVNFIDYVIEDPAQLQDYDDGYYFVCPSDDTVDIYQKTTIPTTWFSWKSYETTKICSVMYAKCNKKVSIIPETNIDKNLYNELTSKLKKRRSQIMDDF